MKRIRVAIYSGAIPSTTFIERLIEGVAEKGIEVILFGKLKGKVRYASSNIQVIANRIGIVGFIQAFFRIVRLRISHPSRFHALKQHLGYGPFASRRGYIVWQRLTPVTLFLPDIFHIQWAKAVSEWLFLKELFHVKLILSLRGSHINYSPLSDRALANMYTNSFPKFDAFHAVSKAIAAEAEAYGVTASKTFVIYSGLKGSELSALLDERLKTLRMLAVGRFHWIKGYHYLLTALAILKSKQQAAHLTLIAQGQMPEEILFQLHDMDLAQDVTWINGLPHDEVLVKMKQHDVLVLPSVEEGIANVVIEAMNVGLPVISTNCGGMPECIDHGVNGFLVPVRDPEAMASALVKFSTLSSDEIEQVRTNAHQTVVQQFNIEKSMNEFVTMYNKVLVHR